MMCKAVLRARDYVTEDGVTIPMIKDDVPIGAEYAVDTSRGVRAKFHNADLNIDFEMSMVWGRQSALS